MSESETDGALNEVRCLLEETIRRMDSSNDNTSRGYYRLSDYEYRLIDLKLLRDDLESMLRRITSKIAPLQAVVDRKLSSTEDEISLIRGCLFKKFDELEHEVTHSTSQAKKIKARHPIGISPIIQTVIGVTKSDQIYYILRFHTYGAPDRPREDTQYSWYQQVVTDKQWAVNVMAHRLWIWCQQLSIPLDHLYCSIATYQGEPWLYSEDDFGL